MTKYLDLKKGYKKEQLKEAAMEIKKGNLVLFPTETVYGIGANGLDAKAVEKIFKAKGRNSDNPLILHISSIDMLSTITKDITPKEEEIIKAFFPGPLTIILKRNNNVPDIVTASLDTVGVRMPKNNIIHDLIELSSVPIAAPSANISSRPSGTNINDIFNELNDKVDYIIDGGDTDIGLESTVIRVIDNVIHILRPGMITKNDLLKYGDVVIDKHVMESTSSNDVVLSPGMKYKHYAPNNKCILVYSDDTNKMIEKIKSMEREDTLVICNEKNVSHFNRAISYGTSLEDISHNIFRLLRSTDNMNISLIIIEGVKEEELGLAIMNRLIRASSYNYIKL